ncbi:MAG: SusF/SusE family outer membrane protein [Cytophagales bacterium]|nr:SusF/SusE family outer membrane protein [Cytophagales bacterium]
MKSIFKYIFIFTALILINAACENENVKPILGDSSTFVRPELTNAPTSEPKVLLPEEALELYEEFEWTKADYGLPLSTNYILAVDTSEAFTSPVVLGSGLMTSIQVTVEEFNSALLKLGLPGFVESSVKVRILSAVDGQGIDTLHSSSITRTATTYQNSTCGDFCTVGLIGSATPGDWNTDTDMRISDPERKDLNTWTLTVYLKAGEAKFRAEDDWADNWGAGDYPSGTATQDGPNIPVPADGYYTVVFNDQSGAYSFTEVATKDFTTVGIIGSATDGGWDADTDLTRDAFNPHIWTGEITLADGEAKFRAEDDWADNWGNESYPSGFGVGNGPNIPVKAGTYYAWFNDATGEYAFMSTDSRDPYNTIGIIGSATKNGWDSDQDLIKNPFNPYRYSLVVSLTEGEAKFRAEDDWADNWGGVDFPSGVGAKDGPNIALKEGKYTIHFHSGTGEYTFLK